jgi:hypothetical protein
LEIISEDEETVKELESLFQQNLENIFEENLNTHSDQETNDSNSVDNSMHSQEEGKKKGDIK